MSEAKPTPWSPARDLVTPDPGGLNRALDRVAAEHLRAVAPHLAPKEEPACGCVHDSPDFVRRTRSERWRLAVTSDSTGTAMAPHATGRKTAPTRTATMSVSSGCPWCLLATANARADIANEAVRDADRMLRIERAARVKAEAERDRLRECHRTAAETVWEVSVARTKVEKALAAAEAEREAYRQHRDLTAHRLAAAEAENGRLQLALNDSIDRYKAQAKQIAAAEAEVASLRVEVSRLRLVYDDPSLDATDGAHPAWWRGSDAGVAGAVRIINEALDGPLPLPGCVGGADLEAVRQRVAALRASVARLVEAGDEARDILNAILDNQYTYRERVDAVDRWVARWAAAKAGRALDAPAGSEAKR